MRKKICLHLILVSFVFLTSHNTFAQLDLDIETGIVFSGYNDVRIPGDGGTLFSLSNELEADPGAFYRIQIIYHFTDRHHLGALYAPLSISSSGQLDRDLNFQDEIFPAATPLEATYKFNSYRLIYRFDFLKEESIDFGIGFSAKIRDAEIAVQSGSITSEKKKILVLCR